MKVSEFTKIIRKVVREEVRAAVKAELNEILKPKKRNDRNVIKHGLNLHERANKVDKISYTKNSALNDILNETANSKVKTMDNKMFTSQDAVTGIRSKFAEAMNPDSDFGNAPSAQEMIPEDQKHINIPDYIQNALTKDYSGLVKAMDKNKSKKFVKNK
jgi:hypothetical protein